VIALLPAALVLAGLLLLGGCATPVLPAADRPADLSIELAIDESPISDSIAAEGVVAAPAHERSSRFVLLPNGDLHATTDPALAMTSALPPYLRTLSHAEVAALWSVTRPWLGQAPASETSVEPALGSRYRVWIHADGRHVDSAIAVPDDGELPDGLRDLVRSFAALAFVPDELPPPRSIEPRRYDFGPDPYARYRHLPSAEVENDGSE
jgi:hypothetical protein